ncbi:MAG: carbon monoxide dehydrogenase subunit G, partial [Alphaproteobacteria bacterium]|nr:carbon monoxide dehydrogenase subunit G [Alphaproteobacteria bacterium]
MELSDEIIIPGKRDDVFAKLIDPEILKDCIPGCEELILTAENEYSAKVLLKIGPIKAKFSGSVVLNTSNAPSGLTLTGAGEGGIAGFAKGGAEVELIDEGDTTLLKYEAKAEIGGKIAQLGSRLITSTSRKLAKAFFDSFEKIMT